MLHTVPIYCCDIQIEKRKNSHDPKKVVQQVVILTNVVLKGFLPEEMVKKNMKHIENLFFKKYKLAESEYLKITQVKLIVQLGYGISNN